VHAWQHERLAEREQRAAGGDVVDRARRRLLPPTVLSDAPLRGEAVQRGDGRRRATERVAARRPAAPAVPRALNREGRRRVLVARAERIVAHLDEERQLALEERRLSRVEDDGPSEAHLAAGVQAAVFEVWLDDGRAERGAAGFVGGHRVAVDVSHRPRSTACRHVHAMHSMGESLAARRVALGQGAGGAGGAARPSCHSRPPHLVADANPADVVNVGEAQDEPIRIPEYGRRIQRRAACPRRIIPAREAPPRSLSVLESLVHP
jgi:hypothetical protein